jgi:hypothetical protein
MRDSRGIFLLQCEQSKINIGTRAKELLLIKINANLIEAKKINNLFFSRLLARREKWFLQVKVIFFSLCIQSVKKITERRPEFAVTVSIHTYR